MSYLKFSKIPSLRNLMKERQIKNLNPLETTLKFHGTVKLHGTHGAICVKSDGTVEAYSRSRLLSIDKDNAGFAAWVNSHKQYFSDNWTHPQCSNVWLYGEWIGPSIQKGVGINQLERKMFVLFGMYYDHGEGHENSRHVPAIEIPETWGANTIGFYSIRDADQYELHLDMVDPNKNGAWNDVLELVKMVEEECPWAKLFDINGLGEGIVFTNYDDPKNPIRFKVKGEKHQATSEKKVREIDPLVANKAEQFVAAVLTESRLNQGISYLEEMGLEATMQNTGTYIKWVLKDILDEESSLLGDIGLEWDQVKKTLNKKIVTWYKQTV